MSPEDPTERQESYRDNLATADKTGRRIWVFPVKPRGKLYRARSILSIFLLAFLFGTPFVKVNGEQLLLFDLLGRKFVIFGLVFRPQDFHIFVLVSIASGVFVILFTAVFGRLFCGWICPQTIFMEMVFRRIEYWIDGNAPRQKKLATQSWNEGKSLKRILKHAIFFAISFLIGNTFLAYIVGLDNLIEIVTEPPSEHLGGLTAMILFSFVFYWIFVWFREQVCTLVCPYGRLQSVLLDSNSIVVAYDRTRGEPRAPLGVGEKRPDHGHCIDCKACVRVCPTGIDIRNGTQLECINCTACIDACNRVMDRVGFPRKLIRYASENKLPSGKHKWFTGRVGIYSVVFAALVILISILTFGRADVETTILRSPGQLYHEVEAGQIRNLYTLKVVNKTGESMPIELRLATPQGEITIIGPEIVLDRYGIAESAFFVDIKRNSLYSPSSLVVIEVLSAGEVLETIRTSFMGPQDAGHR